MRIGMVALLACISMGVSGFPGNAQDVVTQQHVSSEKGAPLPGPPTEMYQYELKFSRELTSDEQRV